MYILLFRPKLTKDKMDNTALAFISSSKSRCIDKISEIEKIYGIKLIKDSNKFVWYEESTNKQFAKINYIADGKKRDE